MNSAATSAVELSAKLREYDIPVQKVPVEKLNRITMKNHQGAIALLSPVGYHRLDQLVPTLFEEGRMPLVMILDGLTDTRNFGAIARTAECAGFDTIVIRARKRKRQRRRGEDLGYACSTSRSAACGLQQKPQHT